jgi:diketogulonate reductase-like aldo/keto reductase
MSADKNIYTDLTSDAEIPLLGLGTWQVTGQECTDAVRTALDYGYRHIDTADVYNNHQAVAQGIKEAEVDREDFFLTTKLWRTEFEPEKVQPAIDRYLEELETDYLDLVLIHWPHEGVDMAETLAELHKKQKEGVINHLGISNYTTSLMKELLGKLEDNHPEIELVNHQFELHPSLYQKDLVEFSKEHGMTVTAYSPVAQTEDFGIEVIQELAEKYDATPAQVIMAWILEKDLIVIPRSKSAEHIKENFDSLDLVDQIADEDYQKIDKLDMHNRIVDPGFAQFED